MNSKKHQLSVVIGAGLSPGFNSVISSSTSKFSKVGHVIRDMGTNATAGSAAIDKLSLKYNSLMGSINRQNAIVSKRANYQSQILDVVALGAALYAPINSAMKFESAMADVKKVVDFTTADGLRKMGDSLKKLSRTIPLAVDGLAQITAAGGQLGVKEKDLIFFTTNVAKMSTAFDMLPDEAGKSMATLSNVFNIPITSLTKLGDALNHISNNSAATARDIVPALARAGGAARQFGLSAENTAAFAGTLVAMGMASEEAGTATAAILQRLQLADKLGPKASNAFAKIGIDAKQFADMIGTDAQGALNTFFDSLNKLEGKDRVGVIVDIVGKNYSTPDATMVGSLEKYKAQLQLVADPQNYLGSMEKEFQTRAATTENAIQLFKNGISELGIAIGDTLLPPLNKLLVVATSFFNKISAWTQKNKELTKIITNVVAGLLGLKLASFVLGYGFTFLLGGFNKLIIGAKGLGVGFSLMGAAIKKLLSGTLAKLGVAFYALGEMMEAAITDGALASIRSIPAILSKFFKEIQRIASPYITSLSHQFNRLSSEIYKNLSPSVKVAIGDFRAFSAVIASSLTKQFKAAWQSIVTMMPNISARIDKLFGGFGNLKENLIPLIGTIGTAGIAFKIFSKIMSVLPFGMISGAIRGTIGTVTSLGSGFFGLAKTLTTSFFSVLNFVGTFFWFLASEAIPFAINSLFSIGKAFVWLGSNILAPVVIPALRGLRLAFMFVGRSAFSVISSVAQLGMALKTLAVNGVMRLIKTFPILGAVMKGAFMVGGIALAIGAIYMLITHFDTFKQYVANVWDYLKEKFGSFKNVMSSVGGVVAQIAEFLKTTVILAFNLGKILSYVGQNINAMIQRFIFGKDVVIPAWESIKAFFSNIWADAIASFDGFITKISQVNIVDTIISVWSKLKTFYTGLFDEITKIFDKISTPIKSLLGVKDFSFSSIGKLFSGNDNHKISNTIAELKPSNTNKKTSQVNNFNVTVNAAKSDDADSIVEKIKAKSAEFGKTFLYDPVGDALL